MNNVMLAIIKHSETKTMSQKFIHDPKNNLFTLEPSTVTYTLQDIKSILELLLHAREVTINVRGLMFLWQKPDTGVAEQQKCFVNQVMDFWMQRPADVDEKSKTPPPAPPREEKTPEHQQMK